MSQNQTPSGAPTLVGLLGLLFLGLKLAHVIDWSWWLVTLPFWGGAALIGAIIALSLISAASAAGMKGAKRRREIKRLRANPATGPGHRMSIGGRKGGDR